MSKGLTVMMKTFVILSIAILIFPWPSAGQSQKDEFKAILKVVDQIEERFPESRNLLTVLRGKLYHHERNIRSPQQPVDACIETYSRIRRDDSIEATPGTNLYSSCEGLSDQALIARLREIVSNHTSVDYKEARRNIFTKIDNHNGEVKCVYTGRKGRYNSIPNPNDMNTEHSWPQSHGAVGVAKSDIYHLFPTDSQANSTRGSLPFGEVSSANWSEGGSKCDGDVFEPRPEHQGNVARALFYFAVRYNKSIGAKEESVLRRWHQKDPVDDAERRRCDGIENIQHNRNPFIDRPDFVQRIIDF